MPFLGKTPSQIVDPEVDIDGGTIDGVAIGSVTANAGAFTNLTATGTLTLPDDGISGDDVNGGTISNFASTGVDDNATSTAITIDADGDVGVGIATPFFQASNRTAFSINGTSSSNLAFGVGGSANTYLLADAAGFTIGNTSSTLPTMFYTNGAERMRIKSDGTAVFTLATDATGKFADNIGEVGSGNFCLQVTNSAETALKPLGFRAEKFVFATGNVGIGATDPSVALDISQTNARIKVQDGTNQLNIGLWDGANYRVEGDANRKILITSYHSDGIHLGGSGASDLIVKGNKVGIGASPSYKLDVDVGAPASQDQLLGRFSSQAGVRSIAFVWDDSQSTLGIGTQTNHPIAFHINGSSAEKMRLDTSGNLLIGKTTPNSATDGVQFIPNGISAFGRSNNEALRLNRNSSNGKVLQFQLNGNLAGKIGVYSNQLYIEGGTTDSGVYYGSSTWYPWKNGAFSDNVIDLGYSGGRFNDAYIYNGVTSGSDEREKQEIAELDEAETRVAVACKGLLRKWRWKDAVEAKDNNPDSDEVARIHFGIIAQELKAAFEAEGLDAGRYGMFIHTTWTDEETGEERDRMGIRYSELLAFIIAAI